MISVEWFNKSIKEVAHRIIFLVDVICNSHYIFHL